MGQTYIRDYYDQEVGLGIYWWRQATFNDAVEDLEFHCLEFSRSFIKAN